MCLPGTVEAVRERTECEGEMPRYDRRTALAGAAATALAAAFPGVAAANGGGRDDREGKRMYDLTHVFRAGFPIFGTPPTFNPPSRRTVVTIPANGFYGQEWTFWEHSATHMDAPGHFIRGGRLSPQITLPELVGIPIVVVDISARAARNPDATLTARDLTRFESRHGRIPNRALVVMNSGWWRKIDNERAFKGGRAFPNYHFPGFRIDAAEWLLEKRNATAIGVDTMSLDPGNSTKFPVHIRWLGANKYGLENLANLGSVRPRGKMAYVGVVPWEAGSGGPARVMAV